MAPQHLRVGIDFGTTNSSIARSTFSGTELVQFTDAATTSRSILYLQKSSQGIISSSGALAIERYLSAHGDADQPGRLIQSLKSYLPVRSLTGTEVFGRHYALEDLISRILTDLRLRAEQQFCQPVRHALAGRPVCFVGAETAEDDAFAIERLRAAYLKAGFDSVTFELEPLAAAYTYQSTLDHTETILIGDFGGGTSDFSLLTIGTGSERKVVGNAGLPFAGDAFDARLIRNLVAPALGSNSLARGLNKTLPAAPAWIYANLERWHYLSFLRTRNVLEILSSAQKRALEPERIQALRALIDQDLGYQLHQAVQRTKNALSKDNSAAFVFSGPEAGTLNLRTSVTRADFERWIAPELQQIVHAVDELLATCGAAPSNIDHVFLTGGTSFVPAVRAIFEARFAGRVVAGSEFTSVAQGLALAAALAHGSGADANVG